MPSPEPDRSAWPSVAAVAGLGLAVVDHLLVLPRLPGPDEKTTASDVRTQVGGPVPTALAQLAKLGGPAGTLLSAWADDADGAAIEADLRAGGLCFHPARCRTAPRTGFAQVWVEAGTGRRSLAASRPDGSGLTAELAAAAVAGV